MRQPDHLEKKIRFIVGLLIMLAASAIITMTCFPDFGLVHLACCLSISVLFARFAMRNGDDAYEKLKHWLGG